MIGPLDGCGLVGCWWLSLIGLQLGCLVAVKATVHPDVKIIFDEYIMKRGLIKINIVASYAMLYCPAPLLLCYHHHHYCYCYGYCL